MSESFEQLLQESDSKGTIKSGEVVTGIVLTVKDEEIQLNIGYKHDGIMARSELTKDPTVKLSDLVQVGDEMPVKVLKVNDGDGMVILGKVHVFYVSETLKKAFEEKSVITAPVSEVVKGGVTVMLDDTKIFIPASLFSTKFEKDLSKYVGQDIDFKLSEFDPKKRRIIGDRKSLMKEAEEKIKEEFFAQVQVGDIYEGVVKKAVDFGVFIDLGGFDGLLRREETGWGRIGNIMKAFKEGETLRVMVLSINQEKKQVALTAKFPEEDPWRDVETEFAEGTVVKGKVARLLEYGAFVELKENVDGLLHVSEIQYGHVNAPADVLTVGQEIEAKVLKLDPEKRQISLSMKALLPEPEKKPKKEKKEEKAEESTADEVPVDIEAFIKKSAEEEEKAALEVEKATENVAEQVEEKAEAAVETAEAAEETAVEKTEE